MEISAPTATAGSSPPAKPVLLRSLASTTPATSSTTTIRRRASPSASATVRRRARTRPRTRRSNTFSGDDGDGPFGPGGGGGGWNYGFGSGSGSGQGWDSSEPDVPAERRSAAEVALGWSTSSCASSPSPTARSSPCGGSRGSSQPASRRCASSPPSAEPELVDIGRTVRSPAAPRLS